MNLTFKRFIYLFLTEFLLIISLCFLFKKSFSLNQKKLIESATDIIKPLTDFRNYSIFTKNFDSNNVFQFTVVSDLNTKKGGISLSLDIDDADEALLSKFFLRVLVNNTQKGNTFKITLNKYYGNFKINYKNGIASIYSDFDSQGISDILSSLYEMIFKSIFFSKTYTEKNQYYAELDLRGLYNGYQDLNDENIEQLPIFITQEFLGKKRVEGGSMFSSLKKILSFIMTHPNRVKLAVISDKSISEMKIMIEKIFVFSEFKSDSLYHRDPIFVDVLSKQIFYVSPIKQEQYFFITVLPNDNQSFENISIYNYIAYMINNYDKDSLIYVLRKKYLIKDLDAKVVRPRVGSPNFFVITVSATFKGIEDHLGITAYIFRFYETFLKEKDNLKDTYEDFRTINKKKFDYFSINNYFKYLNQLSSRLFYAKSDSKYCSLFSGAFLLPEFNKEDIIKAIHSLKNLSNSVMIVEKKEKNFPQDVVKNSILHSVTYYTKNIEEEALSRKIKENDGKYVLRKKNNFLTRVNHIDLPKDALEIEGTKAESIVKSGNLQIFYRLDRTFFVPKVVIFLDFEYFNNASFHDYVRRNSVDLTEDIEIIYYIKIKKRFEYLFKNAIQCGNEYTFEFKRQKGFQLKITAYQDIANDIASEAMFTIFSAYNTENLASENFYLDNIYKTPLEKFIDLFRLFYFNDLIYPNSNINLPRNIENFQKQLVNDFFIYFRKNVNVTSLIYGDIEGKKLDTIKEMIYGYKNKKNTNSKKEISYSPKGITDYPCYVVRFINHFWKNTLDYVYNVLEVGEISIINEIISDIIMLKFNENNAFETTGVKIKIQDHIFLVFYKTRNNENLPSGYIMPNELSEKIRIEIRKVYEDLTIKSFNYESWKEKLIRNITKNPLKLKIKADRAWNDILEGTEHYDNFKKKYLSQIESLQKNEIIEKIRNILARHNLFSFQFHTRLTSEYKKKEEDAFRGVVCNITNMNIF